VEEPHFQHGLRNRHPRQQRRASQAGPRQLRARGRDPVHGLRAPLAHQGDQLGRGAGQQRRQPQPAAAARPLHSDTPRQCVLAGCDCGVDEPSSWHRLLSRFLLCPLVWVCPACCLDICVFGILQLSTVCARATACNLQAMQPVSWQHSDMAAAQPPCWRATIICRTVSWSQLATVSGPGVALRLARGICHHCVSISCFVGASVCASLFVFLFSRFSHLLQTACKSMSDKSPGQFKGPLSLQQ
jgi:hypothetical protein